MIRVKCNVKPPRGSFDEKRVSLRGLGPAPHFTVLVWGRLSGGWEKRGHQANMDTGRVNQR